MALADRIRQARLRAGLTQSQLARAIETSERNVQRWESGETVAPRTAQVVLIARVTGVSLDDLLATDAAEAALPEVLLQRAAARVANATAALTDLVEAQRS